MPNDDRHVELEVAFFSSDRQKEIDALKSGERAAQRAVVLNFSFRPYDYRVWTGVDGNNLSYPESTPSDVASFIGNVGFPRRGTQPPVERGQPHFEAVRYSADGRTQPTKLQVSKVINVGDESEGGWSRITLGPHNVDCNP